MLNISFLACIKVEFIGTNSLYCGKWENRLNSCNDLDLDPIMPNIEPVRVIFKCYNVFKFHVPRSISI